MKRRDFLKTTATFAALPTFAPEAEAAPMKSENALHLWFTKAWRRAVIDAHIPDWDPQFLSRFDSDAYVARLVESRAQSVVCYAMSHVGLFNYPTKIGRQHAGLNGRDIVAELASRCHAKKIGVQLYTSLIYDRWTYDQHPNWRLRRFDGTALGEGSRYGTVCPNSPYREYVRAWVTEMAERYDVEGFRFDMTFWNGVCYCPHCKKRWQDEIGGEMPAKVDWLDERWMTLQRKRETWLAEFAAIATQAVKAVRPQATVEHQASTFPLNWNFGVGFPLVAQNDFLQGDFYGDSLQGSFVRKLLDTLTPNRPFGYETSFSVELRDHTGSKSEALLEAKAAAAISDGAAFIFIDAIDPIGTVNARVHRRMGKVFDRLMPCYAHLGGKRLRDAVIYYSLESKFDMRENGRPVAQAGSADSHTTAAMAAAKHLLGAHIPFAVFTRKDLPNLLPSTLR